VTLPEMAYVKNTHKIILKNREILYPIFLQIRSKLFFEEEYLPQCTYSRIPLKIAEKEFHDSDITFDCRSRRSCSNMAYPLIDVLFSVCTT